MLHFGILRSRLAQMPCTLQQPANSAFSLSYGVSCLPTSLDCNGPSRALDPLHFRLFPLFFSRPHATGHRPNGHRPPDTGHRPLDTGQRHRPPPPTPDSAIVVIVVAMLLSSQAGQRKSPSYIPPRIFPSTLNHNNVHARLHPMTRASMPKPSSVHVRLHPMTRASMPKPQ